MHKNNFDFLRLLFASLVIITHSYPLSGLPEEDWLFQITQGSVSFSYLGVRGFFIISGFLIFQSLQRSKSLEDYFWKRILRLFPALFVVLTLIVLLGPFVYEGIVPYVKNPSVWSYVPNNLTLYRLQYSIAGIFENNPYPGNINGSVWTIQYEFTFYVLLSTLFFIKNKYWNRGLLLTAFILVTTISVIYHNRLGQSAHFIDLGSYFLGGSVLAVFNFDKNIKHLRIFIGIGLILFVLLTLGGYFKYSKILMIPIVIYLGLCSTPIISDIGRKIGELSYGIYIYAFPVQQTLMYYFSLNHIQLMLFSGLISIFLAFLSWHIIEKKALSQKKKLPSVLIKKYFSKRD